jgi:putative ABC transport system permease protein
MRMLLGLLSDVRFAIRALFQRPAFTAIAIVTLALGIGANASIFSVANAVLLRPLPFREPQGLVRVLAESPEIGVAGAGLALGDFQDMRRRSQTLEDLAVYKPRNFDLTGGSKPEVVRGLQATPNLLSVLGIRAALGRTFLPEEENPKRGQVALLTHGFWRRYFGGSSAALGRSIELDGERYQVVGVLPPDFRFPKAEIDVWVPLTVPSESQDRLSHYLASVGRLARGRTIEDANAELAGIAATLAQENPETNKGWTTRTLSLSEHLTRSVRPALLVLSGSVGFLLLIACINVANLLLTRGAARRKEIAIRAALGASRKRLIRLFLIESTLLAVIGAAAGLVLSLWAVGSLIAFSPNDFPRLAEVGVDRTVLVFSLVLALVSGLAFGALPALQLTRLDLNGLTKEGHGTGGRGSSRLRSFFVVTEVAFAFVLLVGAALMFQGFLRLGRVDPGFDPEETLVVQILLSPARYPGGAEQVGFFERLLTEARALPGVTSAAASSAVPLLPLGQNLLPFELDGPGAENSKGGNFAVFSAVTPGYFRTLHIPMVQGRDFHPGDKADAPRVVIVNEVLARRFWPNGNAVGKRLRATIQGTEPVSYEIVGVVGAARERDLAKDPEPALYAPDRQVPHPVMALVLRTQGDPLRLAGPLQSRLLEIDRNQPIFQVTTLSALVAQAGTRTRFYAALLGLFAATGLLLAAVGIYGVTSYSVAQRTREMAIRAALGARSEQLFGLVFGVGLKLALLGMVLGIAGSLALTRVLASLLYDVGVSDPLAFTVVVALLFVITGLACYLPARRVRRVDPRLAIRLG